MASMKATCSSIAGPPGGLNRTDTRVRCMIGTRRGQRRGQRLSRTLFTRGTILLADRPLAGGSVLIDGPRIASILAQDIPIEKADIVDLEGGYLAPGLIDLHVHGGDVADFMDGTPEAFTTVCRAHARHGTTGLLATTTVARHDQHLAFLRTCRAVKGQPTGGATVLGAHFYGPYFGKEAR